MTRRISLTLLLYDYECRCYIGYVYMFERYLKNAESDKKMSMRLGYVGQLPFAEVCSRTIYLNILTMRSTFGHIQLSRT
jgi:hypothetical protein